MTAHEQPLEGRAAGDSLVFLAATAAGLVLGLVSGVVTARVLGPHDRGVYSVVVMLVGLAVHAGSLGLGDAALVEIRSRNGVASAVAGATLTLVAAATAVAAVVLALVTFLIVEDAELSLVAAAAAAVVCTTFGAALAPVLVSVGGSRASSLTFLATSTVTTATVAIWLLVAGGGVNASLLAGAVGGLAGLLLLALFLRRRGVQLHPRIDRDYSRRALRYGIPVQSGVLLSALTARVDLVLVYRLLDAPSAGQYSVALTMTVLAMSAASSVSYGAFPQMAGVDVDGALPLVRRTLRAGLTVTLLSVPPLMAAALVGIPVAFGPEYRAAVLPGVLLVVAGAFSGLLYLAARMAAARNRPGVLPQASLVYLVVLIAGDLALIPWLGQRGAAVAAVLGALAGLLVAVVAVERLVPGSLSRQLVPRRSDIVELIRLSCSLLRSRSRAQRTTSQP